MEIEAFAREIYSQLGPGYSERVYHNAMEVLLREKGMKKSSIEFAWLSVDISQFITK